MLEARRLRKTYGSAPTAVEALRSVDLTVADAEFVAIMGPSGCGKSTLLHLLGGLDTPSAGEVLLNGTTLASLSDDELTLFRRHRVGFVFQFFNLVPVLTAEENIALPGVIAGKRNEGPERVDEVMRLVGISEVKRKVPAQLSGGEQQRVAMARALVNRPEIVLADEPTGNLDYRSGRGLMDMLARFHEGGQSIVLVTHDPSIAAFAQRVVFMRDGLLVDEVEIGDERDPAPLVSRLVRLGD